VDRIADRFVPGELTLKMTLKAPEPQAVMRNTGSFAAGRAFRIPQLSVIDISPDGRHGPGETRIVCQRLEELIRLVWVE